MTKIPAKWRVGEGIPDSVVDSSVSLGDTVEVELTAPEPVILRGTLSAATQSALTLERPVRVNPSGAIQVLSADEQIPGLGHGVTTPGGVRISTPVTAVKQIRKLSE